MRRLLAALTLLSFALIAYQLVLMQVLSFVQWYHFAFMVISVALLGFGAAGTVLSLAREWFLQRSDTLVPLLMMLSGASYALAVPISQVYPVRFDSYVLFVQGTQIVSLVLTYLVFLVPFFLGALAIAVVFVKHVESVGKLYAANLVGSGCGAMGVIGLMWLMPVQVLVAVLGCLSVLAGLLVAGKCRSVQAAGVAALLIVVSIALTPWSLHPSEYKSLSRSLILPDARVTYTESSPFGVVHVVSSPMLRYAPGLSLTYKGSIPSHDVVFHNGDWFGPIVRRNDETLDVLGHSTHAVPHVIADRRRVLVLGARTGLFVLQALGNNAERVSAVETNPQLVHLLQTTLAALNDSLFLHPAVFACARDPRSYLVTDTSRYDLIVLPTLDAFGGTSGVYALQEQYLLTKEAFAEAWERLAPGGVLCISSWIDQPVRNPVRALATIVEMLSEAHIVAPEQHIVAIRNWGMVTFAVKRTPYTQNEIERALQFCERMQFDPLLLPRFKVYERNKYNVLYDQTLFRLVDGLLSPRREEIYREYDFRIAPATDDRPYFSQFLRWESLPRLRELFGQQALPFVELGSFIILLTLAQIALLGVLLILLPLWARKADLQRTHHVLAYFGVIGMAYMFVEMVLIQRFVLYFGQPLYATAAVIGGMLVFSGLGSAVSARLPADAVQLRRQSLLVATLVVAYLLFVTPAIQQFSGVASAWKFVVAPLLIAPLAFLMGMPFPLGLRAVGETHRAALPWAWGINGCASVVATPLATLLAIEGGFVAVMIGAAVLYGAAAVAAGLRPARTEGTS